MEYNHSPISLREGHMFFDGVEVADCIKATANFTPDVWTGRQLGERSASSRWLGYSISGSITRRRTNNWLKIKIQEYMETGKTPEITIQGIMDDPGSDYYEDYGSDTVTLVGCVLTGNLPLLSLDSEGEVLEDEIGFSAKEMV